VQRESATVWHFPQGRGRRGKPSAPVGGLTPFAITCRTLSATGAWIEVWSANLSTVRRR
jgi:hypothetical protein